MLDGADPYEAESWASSTARLGTTLAGTPAVYSYPPYVAIALLPLGALPLALAYGIWTWAGLGIALASTWFLLRAFARDAPDLYVLVPVTLVLSQPALQSMYGGQWSLVMVAAASVLVLALRRGSAVGVAASAAALMAKPQIGALALLGLIWRSARRGERANAIALTASVTGVLSLTAVFAGGWLLSWIGEVPRARTSETDLSTLASVVGPVTAVVIIVLAVLTTVSVDVRARASEAPWLAVTLLVAPYAHPYDALLLIVPTVVIASARRDLAIISAIVTLVLPWVLFLAIPRAAGYESVSIVVPLVIYALVTLTALKPQRPAMTEWVSVR
jgi:hypothetical protein